MPTGGNGKFIAIAVVLLLLIAGGSYWALTRKPEDPKPPVVADAGPPTPSATFTSRNPDDDIPPPPPVVDAGEKKPTGGGVVGGGGGSYQCDVKKCSGASSAELETALSFRVKQAHRCYDNALANDPTLRGKITVAVRVGTNGTVCPNVSIVSNEMGSQAVGQCVAGYFRGANFPAPKSGCVDVNVPINFVPRQ